MMFVGSAPGETLENARAILNTLQAYAIGLGEQNIADDSGEQGQRLEPTPE